MTAFDYSLSGIKLARERCSGVRFLVADAEDMPFRDGQFDTVAMANIVEHVRSPVSLLTEACRVLKPEGRLVISTPSRYRTANFRRVLRGRPIRFNSRYHVTEYTVGQVKELLRFSGFEIVNITSNLKCRTLAGTAAAHGMTAAARLVGSHAEFGDPTVYWARRLPSPPV